MPRTTRRIGAALTAVAMTGSLLAAAPATAVTQINAGPSTASDSQGVKRQLVLAAEGASQAQVKAAIRKAGGEIAMSNDAIGLYTVNGPASMAKKLSGSALIAGTMADQVIGYSPDDKVAERREKADDIEKVREARPAHGPADGKGKPNSAKDKTDGAAQGTSNGKGRGKGTSSSTVPAGDPLSSLQWDMDMIDAPLAHANDTGKGVRVGVMDTGVEGGHPDIAPNFNDELSRNFTTDIPEIDGACEDDPDGSCEDPANVDEGGHGTHVASTIASPRNGEGIVGVAPDAEIVNLRTGQDSGYFFLEATLEALTYAPQAGIDVVNMSYYIDPWAFNCADNPADSPEDQAAQKLTIEATNRALEYARDNGVTLFAAMGNAHMDLGSPTFDDSSPDFPEGASYPREIDNSCLDMPTEGNGVVSVSSVGPSGLKAYYSNYGTEQTTVAAPGGAYRDFFGTEKNGRPENLILAAVPEISVREQGVLDENGESMDPFIISDCDNGDCAYYEYYQGTSMAAPHAAGVGALIVGAKGQPDNRTGGKKMQPRRVEQVLIDSAREKACEASYVEYPGLPEEYGAACEGDEEFNGFYGHGIVNAANAVSRTPKKH